MGEARSTPASAPRQNLGRPVLARSLEVASIRAAATPAAVALPVSDTRGHAVALVDTTAHSREEVQVLAGCGLTRANADGAWMGSSLEVGLLHSREAAAQAGGRADCVPAHEASVLA